MPLLRIVSTFCLCRSIVVNETIANVYCSNLRLILFGKIAIRIVHHCARTLLIKMYDFFFSVIYSVFTLELINRLFKNNFHIIIYTTGMGAYTVIVVGISNEIIYNNIIIIRNITQS